MQSQEKVMRSEIKVEYVLEGGPELDPDEVTAATGLDPSDVRRIGDAHIPKAPQLRSRFNSWSLKSDLPSATDLEEQVKKVLDRLKPAWQVFQHLGAHYEAAISCTIYSYGGDRPAIFFDKETVKRIADLNAEIVIDLYVLD